jgi:DNA-binding FrmR family transcriptional regulator
MLSFDTTSQYSNIPPINRPRDDCHVDYRIKIPSLIPVERKRRMLPRKTQNAQFRTANLRSWREWLAEDEADKEVQLDRHTRRASSPDESSEGCSVQELLATPHCRLAPASPSHSIAEAGETSDADAADILDHIASLEAAFSEAEKHIMQNHVENAIYDEKIVDIKNELFELHLLRQHENGDLKNDKTARQKNGNKPVQPPPIKLPQQMNPYLPTPDLAPSNPDDVPDAPGARRCIVGRPKSKPLRQGIDRH